jgi:hypothetical protein
MATAPPGVLSHRNHTPGGTPIPFILYFAPALEINGSLTHAGFHAQPRPGRVPSAGVGPTIGIPKAARHYWHFPRKNARENAYE